MSSSTNTSTGFFGSFKINQKIGLKLGIVSGVSRAGQWTKKTKIAKVPTSGGQDIIYIYMFDTFVGYI